MTLAYYNIETNITHPLTNTAECGGSSPPTMQCTWPLAYFNCTLCTRVLAVCLIASTYQPRTASALAVGKSLDDWASSSNAKSISGEPGHVVSVAATGAGMLISSKASGSRICLTIRSSHPWTPRSVVSRCSKTCRLSKSTEHADKATQTRHSMQLQRSKPSERHGITL
jgi:hypothetical protein